MNGGLRLALAGGGTGGHIVPGLHLVRYASESAIRMESGAESGLGDLLWFQSGRPVEEHVMGLARRTADGFEDLERVVLDLEPGGGGAPSLARLALRTPPAVVRAREALRRHRSEVLLGLGGFTCLPAVLAARSLGVPVVLLEINASRGRATRVLSGLARRVLHAWRETVPEGARAGTRHAFVGAPLAPGYLRPRALEPDECEDERRAACAALGFSTRLPLLLVLGGSQGASSLNRFVRAHAPALVAGGLQVLHQTGPGRAAEGLASPGGAAYRAQEYLEEVELALGAATLVLCRGGASTLAEVAGAAVPALVVPYPHHADRHQERNARALGEGVRIVREEELDECVAGTILELAGGGGRERREHMARALVQAMPADSAARLYDELLTLRG